MAAAAAVPGATARAPLTAASAASARRGLVEVMWSSLGAVWSVEATMVSSTHLSGHGANPTATGSDPYAAAGGGAERRMTVRSAIRVSVWTTLPFAFSSRMSASSSATSATVTRSV